MAARMTLAELVSLWSVYSPQIDMGIVTVMLLSEDSEFEGRIDNVETIGSGQVEIICDGILSIVSGHRLCMAISRENEV